jgi:hypothetical protein
MAWERERAGICVIPTLLIFGLSQKSRMGWHKIPIFRAQHPIGKGEKSFEFSGGATVAQVGRDGSIAEAGGWTNGFGSGAGCPIEHALGSCALYGKRWSTGPKEVVTTLKTYCESGTFARGKDALSGQASLAVFGNTNQPVDVMVRSSHLFTPMPDVIREDMAFIDRLHYYIPGWEIPKMRIEFFTDHYGFVVDYLAEALRELRKHNFTEVIDRHFSLGSHLNARDVKAVRKTVSGLVKLLYPHGELSSDEVAELVETALEGRRRVKEQLKKMGSFEYHQTSFSYIDNESREERFVGVPEQGGRHTISTDPLAPGSVYAASVAGQGRAVPAGGRLLAGDRQAQNRRRDRRNDARVDQPGFRLSSGPEGQDGDRSAGGHDRLSRRGD